MFYYDRTMKEESIMKDVTKGVIIGAVGVVALKRIYIKGYMDALRKANRILDDALNTAKSKGKEKF